MSSDNGVCILYTRGDGKEEWRVAHVVGVSQLIMDTEKGHYRDGHLNPDWARRSFGKSVVYSDQATADAVAVALNAKLYENPHGVVTQQVVRLNYPKHVFPRDA